MFCINCFHTNTAVANSRAQKKQPSVWRRRKCARCNTVFTTYERPSLADNNPIKNTDGSTTPFNIGKLIISISRSFSHAPEVGTYAALWLAQTVEDNLSHQNVSLTTEDITATTHQVLKKYDELAAVQYGAAHKLISLKPRRGRPSLHGPARPFHE